MIFGLPPIVGVAPLLLYIVLSFKKDMHAITNIAICTVLGAILTGYNLLDFGVLIQESMGSSLAFVSFIVMLATGLSEVLKRTGVSEMIVYFIINKIGVKTQTRAILAVMTCSTVLATLLGTWAGANAVIAPIVIPLVASIGLTKSTLTVLFFGAGELGLILSPLAPPAVVVMELTGITWPEYILTTGIPISIVALICTFFASRIVQKKTNGQDNYVGEEIKENLNYRPSAKTLRSGIAFLVTLVIGVTIGIVMQSGMQLTLTIIVVCSIVAGLAYGLPVNDIVSGILEGRKMWHAFIILLLFNPFINFVLESGAFDVVAEVMTPLMNSAGKTVFCFLASFIGVFGINGAHVAQSPLIDSLFGNIAASLGVSPAMWAMCLTIGTQVTSYAYPGVDMINQMTIARADSATSQKWILFLAYCFIIPAALILSIIMSFII